MFPSTAAKSSPKPKHQPQNLSDEETVNRFVKDQQSRQHQKQQQDQQQQQQDDVLTRGDLIACSFGPDYYRGVFWGSSLSLLSVVLLARRVHTRGMLAVQRAIQEQKMIAASPTASNFAKGAKTPTLYDVDSTAWALVRACFITGTLKFVKSILSFRRYNDFLYDERYAEEVAKKHRLSEEDVGLGHHQHQHQHQHPTPEEAQQQQQQQKEHAEKMAAKLTTMQTVAEKKAEKKKLLLPTEKKKPALPPLRSDAAGADDSDSELPAVAATTTPAEKNIDAQAQEQEPLDLSDVDASEIKLLDLAAAERELEEFQEARRLEVMKDLQKIAEMERQLKALEQHRMESALDYTPPSVQEAAANYSETAKEVASDLKAAVFGGGSGGDAPAKPSVASSRQAAHLPPPSFSDGFAVGLWGSLVDADVPNKPVWQYYGFTGGKFY